MTNESYFSKNRFQSNRLFVFTAALILSLFAAQYSHAHQQPTTIVLLDVDSDKVAMELQIPLSELELATGYDVTNNTDTLIERLKPQLSDYLLAHVRPESSGKKLWSVEVVDMKVSAAEQTQSGPYQEIVVHLNLTPPANADTRRFTLNYDVIMHQVVTHVALVSIRNDWESGIVGEHPVAAGAILVDTRTTQIFPLEINLEKGGWFEGFSAMLALGMRHIKEGTDHLLFLLVLLLPAPLLVRNKNWAEFGGAAYSVKRLLKIVTAFTVGHSLTLLIGALGWLQLPPQPIEVLIAVSILVSAIHAVRPIFPGREIYVAAGFGLIHGLAFATVLFDLNLDAPRMALSILGFNLGIELMQLFVIALVVPWLIIAGLTPFYKWIRIVGATLAMIAASAWIVERVSGASNAFGDSMNKIAENAHLGVLALAIIALAAFGWQNITSRKNSVEVQP